MKMRAWMTLTAACLLGACGQSTDQYDTTSIIGPGGTASPSPRTSPSLSPTASPSPSPSPSPASSPLASPSPAATARFVTNDTAVQDYRCGFSPDGSQIFVIDLQAPAGTPPVLFDAGQGRAPSWSPNGQTITFESNRATLNEPAPPPTASPTNAPFAIYSKPFPTGVPTQITDKSLNANHCVWSRDGRLLVMSAVLPGNSRGIYVMPAP